ncbi:hypothetical protein ACFLRF_02770 [Candidatus Altiarchaeota archaeon]
MPVVGGLGGNSSFKPPGDLPNIIGPQGRDDGFLAEVMGVRVFDAVGVLAGQSDISSFLRSSWRASPVIRDVAVDGAPRDISMVALESLTGLFESSQREGKELSHIYRVSGWPYPGSSFTSPPVISSVRGYESGSFGMVQMPDPGSIESSQIRGMDFGDAAGIGHIHPPGFGPAPSGAYEDQDVSILRLYQDACLTSEWDHPAFTVRPRFQSEYSHMHLSPEHLFAAPAGNDARSMLVGLCRLDPDPRVNRLVYHRLSVRE